MIIADTGNGIPESEISFIFERFYRVDRSRSDATGGAGLGLAITKRIVELHDGEIAVASEPLAGACFSFSLPVRGTIEQCVV
jgi:signal transduction histidine kinase